MREDLLTAVVAAIVSIVFGFVQLYIERWFLWKKMKSKLSVAEKIGRGEVRTVQSLRHVVASIRPKAKESSDLFTGLQLISLGTAATAYVIVMAHILLAAQ
ncbi:MAG TPA: hypothetical protein VHC98_01520 [Candidatus Saccharimonadales bacterium]|nr:hypothetical protein [Candidatus Saccharimonadales bacterium]